MRKCDKCQKDLPIKPYPNEQDREVDLCELCYILYDKERTKNQKELKQKNAKIVKEKMKKFLSKK